MILNWDKPKKKMSKEDWLDICADSAPPGVYTPNMSDEDVNRWKAKIIKGKYPRVEIRKCLGCLAVIIVLRDGHYPKDKRDETWCKMKKTDPYHKTRVRISANGPMQMTWQDWGELKQAVEEAIEVLEKVD